VSRNKKVGYKNPPRRTRFKKGESGNPKGRPPRPVGSVTRKAQQSILKAFRQKAKDAYGKPTRMTGFELTALKCLQEAAKRGDTKAFLSLFKLATDCEAGTAKLSPLKIIVEGGLPK